jgi:hypothetical protein
MYVGSLRSQNAANNVRTLRTIGEKNARTKIDTGAKDYLPLLGQASLMTAIGLLPLLTLTIAASSLSKARR